jgi:simple sugar transport system permease protein
VNAAIARLAYRYGLLVVLVALLVWFSTAKPRFRQWDNALIILQSVAIVAIVALGVTVSMAAGGFDLSVGANVSFVVMVTALVMIRYDLSGATAIVAGLLAGLLVAVVNTLLIVVARVPDLIATLGTLFIFQGFALIITSGKSVSVGMPIGDGEVATGQFADWYRELGNGDVLSIPIPVLFLFVIAVLVYVFLTHTRWGRAQYAIGGNPAAARLAGIPVQRYRALAYVISGLLAAIGGILLSARLGRGDIGAGNAYLLQAVAATLIGFAVLGANRPNAVGTVVGALFVGVLFNGLTMFNVPYYAQDFIQGVLLVLTLVVTYTLSGRVPRSRPAHDGQPTAS